MPADRRKSRITSKTKKEATQSLSEPFYFVSDTSGYLSAIPFTGEMTPKSVFARQVIDRDKWQLKKDAPHWVINMYHDALYNNASYDDNPQSILKEMYEALWNIAAGEMTSIYGEVEKKVYEHILAQKPLFRKDRYVEEYSIDEALEKMNKDLLSYQV